MNLNPAGSTLNLFAESEDNIAANRNTSGRIRRVEGGNRWWCCVTSVTGDIKTCRITRIIHLYTPIESLVVCHLKMVTIKKSELLIEGICTLHSRHPINLTIVVGIKQCTTERDIAAILILYNRIKSSHDKSLRVPLLPRQSNIDCVVI